MISAPGGSAALVKPNPVVGSQCNLQGTPGNVDRLGVFSWSAVAGADHYEFFITGDPGFGSNLFSDTSIGQFNTQNTRATVTKTLPTARLTTGALRAVGGRPTPPRSMVERVRIRHGLGRPTHRDEPDRPQAPTNGGRPDRQLSHPVKLSLGSGRRRAKYRVSLSSSSDLSSELPGFPVTTSSTTVLPPARLAAGDYWWGVTPVDAQSHDGIRLRTWEFTWSWPRTAMTRARGDGSRSRGRGVRPGSSRGHRLPALSATRSRSTRRSTSPRAARSAAMAP